MVTDLVIVIRVRVLWFCRAACRGY